MLDPRTHPPACTDVGSRLGRASGTHTGTGGFTLIELLVSVVVLAVGLLALLGASAVVARQVAGGGQLTVAATIAQSRFEVLRARPCSLLTGGWNEHRGIREVWSVKHGDGLIEITDTVIISGRNGPRVHAFRSSIPCPADP